jgi:hypothetical protein
MKDFESRWQQLVAAARQAPAPEGATAPYGFATRVAARALAEERPGLLAVFGRFSVRALWVAGLLMLASVVANYLGTPTGEDDSDEGQFDPVVEFLSASSS